MADPTPEGWRKAEIESNRLAAEVAGMMLERRRWRWLLRPLHRLFKWAAAQADRELREDGWR